MIDPVIEAAKNRISAIEDEMALLERLAELYVTVEAKLSGVPRQQQTAKGTPQKQFAPLVTAMLLEKKLASTRDIYEWLREQGITVRGRNPVGNLGAKLSQMPEFENIKGLGWRMRKMGATA